MATPGTVSRPGRAGPAALARAAARAPFGAPAWRALLFCAVEVPLGLCVLLLPAALAGVPLLVMLLANGGSPPPRAAHTHPAGGAAPLLAGAVLVMLAGFLVLLPRIARWLGAAHRCLAGWLLGEHIPAPPAISRGGGVGRWLSRALRDGPGWRAAGYLAARLPVTVGECYAAFLAAAGLANLTYPFWWPLFRNHPPGTRLRPVPALTPFGALHIATFPGTFTAFAAGAAMVLAAPWAARAVTSADRWLMRGLLGRGRLAQRITDLEQTRALAVNDSAALLRQVERNLHDGAQIRLATLAMNLGMAREKLGSPAVDLAAVRELVEQAHLGAKDALGELRELARGIHPPVLDNGLADALATLVASSGVPAELSISIARRPSAAIESIAYFCAAELLANAVKHSAANMITVEAAQRDSVLLLTVTDDGTGGADPRGSGLAGLAQRIRTVDGRLAVSSPPGGPTRVRVELPLRA